MTRQATPQEVASARPRRTPLSARNRLDIKNKKPGLMYRIVNDVEDRVSRMQEQGYEIVSAEEAGMIGDKRVDNISAPGSSSYVSVGQGVKAVAMAIKREWYDEDQASKQRRVDDSEQTMKTTLNGGDYVPKS